MLLPLDGFLKSRNENFSTMKLFALLLIAFFCLSAYARNQTDASKKPPALFDGEWQWTLENARTFSAWRRIVSTWL
jgi:hypothetical protein